MRESIEQLLCRRVPQTASRKSTLMRAYGIIYTFFLQESFSLGTHGFNWQYDGLLHFVLSTIFNCKKVSNDSSVIIVNFYLTGSSYFEMSAFILESKSN